MTLSGFARRRGGRSVAAVLAALLMASVLAVVAGAPAQAANTAHEVLVDHDNDASTDMVREFAGVDRYDTALRLGKNLATSKGGLGSVPVVFLSSGVTLVDSISAAGLAGYTDAPILLTPGESLPAAVADFIQDYGVGTVYVLGGPAAISDDVVDEIIALDNNPTATRIAGADRYSTATMAASMIESVTSWCGTDAKSAVLINGATDALSFGVAVQTSAYRMQLPVLMTAADELPEVTADFIADNDIEHVQIIGDTDTVSAGVASALTRLGVGSVDRTDGATAAEVSVQLAMDANNGCNDDLAPVATNRVVLVRGNPDGVTAAPVLSSTLADGAMVTPLVVGGAQPADMLPRVVRDYLAATPKAIGGTKVNLGIVAIGGTSAISEAVMDEAIAAAASSGALTAAIGASTDTNRDGVANGDDPVLPASEATTTFSLYFNDDVAFNPDPVTNIDADLVGKLRDIVEVNGVPAAVDRITLERGGTCSLRKIDVTIQDALVAGDRITVAASGLKLGSGDDQRTLAPVATETVAAPPRDTIRPSVQIIGIADRRMPASTFPNLFHIRVSDANGPNRADTITLDDLIFTPAPGSSTAQINVVDNDLYTDSGGAITVSVTRLDDSAATNAENQLVPGDRLTVKAGAVSDVAGNVNGTTSGRAIAPQASPRITAVLMSQPHHSTHASWTVPTVLIDPATNDDEQITITARAGGAAAGALGNDWSLTFDVASTWDPNMATDIDVRVNETRQEVYVRFVNGPATVGQLLAALKASSDFAAVFSAGAACEANLSHPLDLTDLRARRADPVNPTIGRAVVAGGGSTQFAIEVRFSGYILGFSRNSLYADLLAATLARFPSDDLESVAGTDVLNLEPAMTDNPVVVFSPGAPVTTIRIEGETDQAPYLPRNRDLVVTTAGSDVNNAVATGYAADNSATTDVHETFNGASRVRITVSSSVPARR